jgi:hypothetical protein
MLHRTINALHLGRTIREWHFLLAAYELHRNQWQRRSTVIEQLTAHAWPHSTIDEVMYTLTTHKLIETRNVTTPGTNIRHAEVRVTTTGANHLKECFKLTKAA